MARWAVLIHTLTLALLTACTPILNLGREPLVRVTLQERESLFTTSRFLLIDISDMISASKSEKLFREGTSLVEDVHDALEEARHDRTIKAVIVRIDSPGGEVTASDIIRREILRYAEETEVPVVAQLMGVAASGGYYIATAADRIVAHPTTVTGSIGVLLVTLNVEGLENLIGIQVDAVTSGPHKDILSPFRAMTDDERAIVQGIVDDLHRRFVDAVSEGRGGEGGLDRAQIEALADGRIFTAQQALEAGLIDEVAYLPETIESLKEELGLRDVEVISYRRGARGDYSIYAQAPTPPAVQVDLINPEALSAGLRPGFYYLWAPGLSAR